MISVLDNYDLRGKKQNFARDAFETIADMKAFSENYLPPIFDAYCYENGLKYRYNVSNDVDPETGKWRVIGENGGGGDLSSYYTKTQTNALLEDKVDKVVGKDLSDENFTSEEKTKLAGLENYDDTAIDSRVTANENAITVLNGNDTVTGSVDNKVASCLSDSKDYTDLQVHNAIRQTAIVCDAKPTISGDTITYYQYGNEYTITSDNKTKFYYTSSGVNYTTIWIEGREFTDTIASVDFSDYVSKANDVVSTYTGSEADKTKVPTLASMDALKSIVDTDLAAKFDTSDIQSTITSASGNPVSSSALYTEFAKKVDIDQGTANEGKILQVNASGNLALTDPSALGGDASSVDYTNASYPELNTVKKALDDLIEKVNYVDPAISSFTMTPATDTYEVGASVNELTFNWAYNKNVLTQNLTDCTLADETVRTATYSTPVTANKTFTLTANDGTKSVTKSLSIKFQNKIYWGSSAAPVSDYDSAFILALNSSKFATAYKGSYTMTVGTGEYGYVACPHSWNIPAKCKIGGFETELVKESAISFTNASGGTVSYDIVRTTRSGLGNITMLFE
jgi:hypothetical protein